VFYHYICPRGDNAVHPINLYHYICPF
jgi:hypothetical protein